MEAKTIKEYIYNNEKIVDVLEALGMHHIKWHGGKEYLTCGMPDGDNPQSTTIFNGFLIFCQHILIFANSFFIYFSCNCKSSVLSCLNVW